MTTTKNGGYVIIDISKEDFSDTVIRKDIYNALQINGAVGKPVLIYPKAGVGGVFAQVAEDSGTYTIGFTDAGGYMGTVIVSSDGEVRRTYTELPAESEVSALDDRVEDLEGVVNATSYLAANAVDLTEYPSSGDPYVTLVDGYVIVNTGELQSGIVRVIVVLNGLGGGNDIYVNAADGTWLSNIVPVRKGTSLYIHPDSVSGGIAKFCPASLPS